MANLCWPAVLASLVVALLSNAPLAAGHDMSAPRATDPHYYEGFANPIRMHAPDPSILYADGVYAMVYTSDRNISMTRASTLAGLEAGETRLIWDDDTEERAAHMWAPEIHLIDETWYLFYSACNSSVPCCETCKTRVLRGCDGPQPYECTYEYLATLVPEPGLQGGLHKNESFSIDGTYMEIPGWGRYHVVSARGHGGMQSIQITELDTDSWTVKEWHIISAPDQTWEANATNTVPSPGIAALEEAPNPLYYKGEIWLTFSASSCATPNYAIGLLHWNGGNPLDESSWDKNPGPVMRPANSNWGTGHNCNFLSPDGTEVWNAYHATSNETGHCGDDRFSMAHKIEFDDDNWPIFGQPPRLGEVIQAPSGE